MHCSTALCAFTLKILENEVHFKYDALTFAIENNFTHSTLAVSLPLRCYQTLLEQRSPVELIDAVCLQIPEDAQRFAGDQ